MVFDVFRVVRWRSAPAFRLQTMGFEFWTQNTSSPSSRLQTLEFTKFDTRKLPDCLQLSARMFGQDAWSGCLIRMFGLWPRKLDAGCPAENFNSPSELTDHRKFLLETSYPFIFLHIPEIFHFYVCEWFRSVCVWFCGWFANLQLIQFARRSMSNSNRKERLSTLPNCTGLQWMKALHWRVSTGDSPGERPVLCANLKEHKNTSEFIFNMPCLPYLINFIWHHQKEILKENVSCHRSYESYALIWASIWRKWKIGGDEEASELERLGSS